MRQLLNQGGSVDGAGDFQRKAQGQFALGTHVEERHIGVTSAAAIDDAKKVVLNRQIRRRSRKRCNARLVEEDVAVADQVS